jgi:hypothetical protein
MGGFVWARRVLDRPKRRFPARADAGSISALGRWEAGGDCAKGNCDNVYQRCIAEGWQQVATKDQLEIYIANGGQQLAAPYGVTTTIQSGNGSHWLSNYGWHVDGCCDHDDRYFVCTSVGGIVHGDDHVQCPKLSAGPAEGANRCDCGNDCANHPDRCACANAQACCGAAGNDDAGYLWRGEQGSVTNSLPAEDSAPHANETANTTARKTTPATTDVAWGCGPADSSRGTVRALRGV